MQQDSIGGICYSFLLSAQKFGWSLLQIMMSSCYLLYPRVTDISIQTEECLFHPQPTAPSFHPVMTVTQKCGDGGHRYWQSASDMFCLLVPCAALWIRKMSVFHFRPACLSKEPKYNVAGLIDILCVPYSIYSKHRKAWQLYCHITDL